MISFCKPLKTLGRSGLRFRVSGFGFRVGFRASGQSFGFGFGAWGHRV